MVNFKDTSGSPERKPAERFFDNVALSKFTTYVIQRKHLQRRKVILWRGGVSDTGQRRRWGADFIRQSVYGFRRWSGDFVTGGVDDLCTSGFAILFGTKWCEVYRVCI